MARRLWTKEEFILTLDLYFRIPFGQFDKGNPDIIRMAKLINRTPSSVAMRLCNYAYCDPALRAKGVVGLAGGYAQCLPFWEKYSNKLGELTSEAAKCRKKIIEATIPTEDESLTRTSQWDSLVNELYNFKFQSVIKKNYHERCAISSLKADQFLVGCHIIPVENGEEENIDASNGLCLTILYARAFMEGLIGIDTQYRVHISSELKSHQFDKGYYSLFKKYDGSELSIKDVVIKPNPQFLELHMDTIFDKKKEDDKIY